VSARPDYSLKRVLPAIAVFGVIAYLVVKVLVGLGEQDPMEAWEAPALEEDLGAVPSDGAPRMVVRGIESQHTELVVDGEVFFSGILKGGETLSPPAGHKVEVALPDLTRAAVIYNGTRVGPLGKLNAGRRLVFIDDVN
jgi:hypothetical protein